MCLQKERYQHPFLDRQASSQVAKIMKFEHPEDVCLDQPTDEVWTKVLELLSKKVSQPFFMSWLRPTRLIELDAKDAVIAVANDFGKSQLTSPERVKEIEQAFFEVLGRKIKSRVTVSAIDTDYTPTIASISIIPESRSPRETEKRPSYESGVRQGNTNLNPKHDFASYVVGSSNRFSHAAAFAVADKPGQAYNPLFLYGGVGLGKTHLLHAIGNEILKRAPHTVIRYMSCEKFTNEVINSIRGQSMTEFRKKYRQIDLLLMDDIQFIEGKESTQEEFFHTFNHLRENGKQIVLSSDRPPKELGKLTERLRSRFEWGLITDIQAPDYEMRLAILRKKAEDEKMSVPDDVLDYIASTFTSNIRELEGALLRATAYASLAGGSLTRASLAQVLQPGGARKDKTPLTVERIIDAVAAHYQVEPADIRSSKRSQDLTIPRHIAMYLANDLMSLSLPRVGQSFGNRKHTSVLYACNKVKTSISEDPVVAEAIRRIIGQLDA